MNALELIQPMVSHQVIAPLYAKVLAHAANALGLGPAYDSLWPTGTLRSPWSLALERLYQEVASLQVVPSAAASSGGSSGWLRPDQVTFLDDAVSKCDPAPVRLRLNSSRGACLQ